jgi:riboflavin kinase / FMN adenylyltransferase
VIHVYSLNELTLQNTWLTIGIFDGVHRGHQEILRTLVDGAHVIGCPAVVLTFDPHPAVVLHNSAEVKCLTTSEERLTLLELLGVDVVITQTFDRAFADQTAEDFMREAVRHLGMQHLVIGYDTALGRKRQGNATLLTEIGKELDYRVQVVPPLTDEKGVISSTRIRCDIAAGNVSAAAAGLGRYYDLSGPVIRGDGRGHRINIPTANIQPPSCKLVPANGIYACWAFLEPQCWGEGEISSGTGKYLAATNVGVRPTFTPDLPASAIEAHLLDFNRDIYGQQVKLEFVEYLRPEQKYENVESLVEQIHNDIELARNILARNG